MRCGAGQRKTLERLCRYITRPALANDRVQMNASGQVELIKCPWERRHDASGDVALEFMHRLAALVSRPRSHLIRFGGRITSLREMSVPPLRAWVLAPNAKLRAKVVPRPREEPAQGAPSPEDTEVAQSRPMRLGWAKLLKRVFSLDLEHCPNCGGALKVIAAILEVSSDTLWS